MLRMFLVAWTVAIVSAAHSAAATQKKVTDPVHGFSVVIPDTWLANTSGLSRGAPLALRNFPEAKFGHGGIMPDGGAQILIRTERPEIDEYKSKSLSTLVLGLAERMAVSVNGIWGQLPF